MSRRDWPDTDPPPPMCPACGYNLTGTCTVEKPTGVCPECGAEFSPETMWPAYRPPSTLRSMMTVLLVIEVLLLPGLVILLPMLHAIYVRGGVGGVLVPSAMITACVIGGLLGLQYQATLRIGVPRRGRPFPWGGAVLSGLLFAVALLILATVYFCGGCLVLLSQLNYP